MKILSQIYVGENKFLLSLLGDTKDLNNLPTEYAADDSRFLNTDSNAVYVYTSADGWEITEAGQMKDLPVVSATDNGKVLKVANGVWSIGTDEGGSLPANFPAEGAANANKYIGFDANGDYTAKEGGSGGESYDTVFTTHDGVTFAASHSIADIIAASVANKPCQAKAYLGENYYALGSISMVSSQSTSETVIFSFLMYDNGTLQFQALIGVRSRELESDEWSQDSWMRTLGDVLPDYSGYTEDADYFLALVEDSQGDVKPSWKKSE